MLVIDERNRIKATKTTWWDAVGFYRCCIIQSQRFLLWNWRPRVLWLGKNHVPRRTCDLSREPLLSILISILSECYDSLLHASKSSPAWCSDLTRTPFSLRSAKVRNAKNPRFLGNGPMRLQLIARTKVPAKTLPNKHRKTWGWKRKIGASEEREIWSCVSYFRV